MRICCLEPSPRPNGAVTFQIHLREGMRRLGHECDMLGMTRSGKPSGGWGSNAERNTPSGLKSDWWPHDLDGVVATRRPMDAAARLDEYDLVVLTEPSNTTADREAYREVTLPAYVKAFELMRTPWTSVVHGPHYDYRKAPFLPELLRTPSFSGVLIARDEAYWPGLVEGYYGRVPTEKVKSVPVMRNLPYAPAHDISAPLPSLEGTAIGMTARVISNKGQLALCAAADQLSGPVAIYGQSSKSHSPSPSFVLWEKLAQAHGFTGERPRWPLQVLPWKLVAPSGNVVEYRGMFSPDEDPYGRLAVHCSLTSRYFAHGRVEYVHLEAMDRGCMLVCPSNNNPEGRYRIFGLDRYMEVGDHDKKELADAVNAAWDAAHETELRGEIVLHNRKMLRELEDPAQYAAKVLEAVRP